MAICKKCNGPFSDQEFRAGFTCCEYCGEINTKCLIHHHAESVAVGWVLHASVEDASGQVGKLTDEEIEYCSQRENRLMVRKLLVRELNKRVAAKVKKAGVLP